MSQEVSTNPRASKPLTSSNSIQPWSAEASADKLMDELFSDIDRILDGGSRLPTEPAKPEYVSLQPIVIPQIAMPPAVIPPQELEEQPSPEPSETPTTPVEPLERRVDNTASAPVKRSGWSIEKLLLALGITSLVVTLALLLANQQKLTWPGSGNSSSSSSVGENSQLSASDSQFVSYMLRSLQVIDHRSKTKQNTTATASAAGTTNQSSANLQSLPTTGNRLLGSNQPPTVLERVYIPVYPSQSPAPPAASQPTVRPSVQAAAPVQRPPAQVQAAAPVQRPPAQVQAARPVQRPPAQAQAARPAQKPPARAQAPSPVARLSPPPAALPPAPAPVAPPPAPAPAAPSLPDSSSQAAAVKHTLVGLLELGDRSAALFEVNGVTQRFNIGESIGNSGWTLVSVANQEAVIRRNGEVRSVYVGQKF